MYRLHWYAHTEGCCTDGAGRNVQDTLVYAHTEGPVQMEPAEVYRLHCYAHTEGRCTNGAGRSVHVTLVRTQRGAVQMEPAEVYRYRKCTWIREAKNGEGADKAHGEESCVTSRLFHVFQTGQG